MKIRTLYITISNTSKYSKTIPKLKHFLVRYITGAKKTCLFFYLKKQEIWFSSTKQGSVKEEKTPLNRESFNSSSFNFTGIRKMYYSSF